MVLGPRGRSLTTTPVVKMLGHFWWRATPQSPITLDRFFDVFLVTRVFCHITNASRGKLEPCLGSSAHWYKGIFVKEREATRPNSAAGALGRAILSNVPHSRSKPASW